MTRNGIRLLDVLLAVAVAAAPGCGDDEDFEEGDIRAATYNAGLAPGFVPLTEERAPATVDAIAGIPANLLCVQELWRPQDLEALMAQTAERLPAALALEPMPVEREPGAPPACSAQTIDPLAECVFSSCGELPRGQLLGCVLSECGAELSATAPTCQRCLGATVGAPLEEAVQTCAAGPGPQFAFDASFGTALLTSGEILEEDALVLDSTLNRRAVLFARVRFPDDREVDVYCTHLSAVLQFPFPGKGSWEAEQAGQIDALLSFIEETTQSGTPTLLMGDLNTGPAAGEAEAELPENYERLIEAGFVNPYLEQAEPECTVCADNRLAQEIGESDSVIIDHILVRDLAADVVRVSRVLTEPIELEGDEVPASDHFGVFLGLSSPSSSQP